MLLDMVDGGILKVNYDSESWSGCETCDYGSSYINDFEIEMTSGKVKIKVDQMYEYDLSEGYMMELILHNVDEIKVMTEMEFYKWVEEKVKVDSKQYSWSDVEVEVKFESY